jgi:hypothetical protein
VPRRSYCQLWQCRPFCCRAAVATRDRWRSRRHPFAAGTPAVGPMGGNAALVRGVLREGPGYTVGRSNTSCGSRWPRLHAVSPVRLERSRPTQPGRQWGRPQPPRRPAARGGKVRRVDAGRMDRPCRALLWLRSDPMVCGERCCSLRVDVLVEHPEEMFLYADRTRRRAHCPRVKAGATAGTDYHNAV